MNGGDPFDAPELQDMFAAARRELGPKVKASAVGLSILSGEVDPKIAIEIGYILLLDKPLILIVMPGTHVPKGLAKAAAAILEWHPDGTEMGKRVSETMKRLGM